MNESNVEALATSHRPGGAIAVSFASARRKGLELLSSTPGADVLNFPDVSVHTLD
ncbi:hypothetical protein [Caballeronia sordidicola]|uniref:hypothetical protein n=1 Tax=Caballeronia sordidicola TaxID=196367 RepID=UPI0012FDF939|nr:hypothetical protein [Caballeronia sordidicola]